MSHRLSRRPGSNALRARAGRADARAACPLIERLETRLALAVDLVAGIGYAGGVVAPGTQTSVDVSVTNLGDTDAPDSVGHILLSLDEIFGNGDDVFLTSYGTGIVAANGGVAGNALNVTIPIDLAPGLWRLGNFADVANDIAETDETNNTADSGDTIVRNVPDIEALLTFSEPAPLPVPGDTVEVTFAFVNLSDFAAGAHTSRVVLSSDSTFGNEDDRVLFEREFSGIDPFGSPGFVEELVIPADLDPGTWRLGVLADVDDELVELSEENNQALTAFDLVIVAESRPDLVPDADFTSLNTPSLPGLNLNVEFAVSNLSDFLAGASTARLVLSLDDILGNEDDLLLADVSIGGLGSSATELVSRDVTIPANLEPGAWFLGIILDATQEIDEQDEANNTLLSPEPVVTVFPPSDVNIVIFGGSLGSDIINHETKAQRSKGTGFGPVLLDDATKSATFVIFNGGNDQLFISGIEVRGQRPGDFAITVLPEFTVAGGSTQSFTVAFDPTDYGTRRANIAIFSSDPDRPRFTMRIAGRGIPDPALPDIDVTGGAASISDGDRKARANTGARFGAAPVGGDAVRLFTITNTTDSILTFNSPVIRIAGTNPDDFQIASSPAHATLAPGESTIFTIRFVPTVTGLRRATIEVLSDDPDEGVFDFRVIGTGL